MVLFELILTDPHGCHDAKLFGAICIVRKGLIQRISILCQGDSLAMPVSTWSRQYSLTYLFPGLHAEAWPKSSWSKQLNDMILVVSLGSLVEFDHGIASLSWRLPQLFRVCNTKVMHCWVFGEEFRGSGMISLAWFPRSLFSRPHNALACGL
jgi:hypothetical protein